MTLWRATSSHPGWPPAVGPVRVRGGAVELRPVRLRDGAQWSRIRLADRAHLEPWEPSTEVNWDVRHAISQWPAVCSGLRSEARKGRMLPYVIEVDGEFSGQLTIGNVIHGALRSAWIGYWVASSGTGGGGGAAARGLGRGGGRAGPAARHGPGVRSGRVASAGGDRAPGDRRQPGRAGEGRLPRRGPAEAVPGRRRRLARSPTGWHHGG